MLIKGRNSPNGWHLGEISTCFNPAVGAAWRSGVIKDFLTWISAQMLFLKEPLEVGISMTASNWSLFDLWATSCRIKQRAKQPAYCQIDSLSRWNRRQAVMWWGCVSVGAPGPASPAWADCLPLIACLSVCVCGFCVGASALLCLGCLFTLQASGEQSFAGSCYCIPAPPKSRTLRFFCAPWMAPRIH